MLRRRWLILAIGLPLYMGLMAWLLSFIILLSVIVPEEGMRVLVVLFLPWEWELDDRVWWIFCGLPAAVLCASQLLFLIPMVANRPLERGRAKSFTLSMVTAGLVAAALTLGLALGLLGLIQLISANAAGIKDPTDARIPGEDWIGIPLTLLMVLSWLLWSMMLIRFARRREGQSVYGRILGLLLGGTFVEVLIVLPLDVMVRRRTDCYCATGSFWTLCICAWALLWLAGPGIVIAAASKRRRLWRDTHCAMCGYQKGPRPAEKCPECGYEWTPNARQAASG